MALTDLKNRTASDNRSKLALLLDALPEDERNELLDVLKDDAYSILKLTIVLKAEAADPNRTNGVPAEMYDISERTLYRERTVLQSGTPVKGL
mgnify:FL=1